MKVCKSIYYSLFLHLSHSLCQVMHNDLSIFPSWFVLLVIWKLLFLSKLTVLFKFLREWLAHKKFIIGKVVDFKLNTIWLEIQDSGLKIQDLRFKIQNKKYENAFQKKLPDFRKLKYVSTTVLLFHTKFFAPTQGLFTKIP